MGVALLENKQCSVRNKLMLHTGVDYFPMTMFSSSHTTVIYQQFVTICNGFSDI